MRPLLLVFVLAAGVAYATTILVSGPSGNFTTTYTNGTLIIDGSPVKIPKISQWSGNGSYTVFGIWYADPTCILGVRGDTPRFYISCSKGTDVTVVAVKDPKAKVTCRDNRGNTIQPVLSQSRVEVYQAQVLSVECWSESPAVVAAPPVLKSILAGATIASSTALFILAILLLRRG
ncbi:MAG: hypothetical protein ABWK05_04880 [Pyrobaculum sp.]